MFNALDVMENESFLKEPSRGRSFYFLGGGTGHLGVKSGAQIYIYTAVTLIHWKMEPFEDVFPIENGDIPWLC